MAGLRGLHRDLRGLLVADLADQDDVGILAEDRAERARERQLGLLVDLRLVDAGNLVLDRILDRDDVGAARLDRRDRGAERRRLAAAGRADDQDHAVLVLEEEAQLLHRRRPRSRAPRAAAPPCGDRARAGRSSRRACVRSVETRKSTSLPSSVLTRRRPSCGSRFSAMSMPAMIFMRATSPSWTHLGRSITSLRMPSRRWRTSTPFSIGSMCTSLARLVIALLTTRSTRSMIGAESMPSRAAAAVDRRLLEDVVVAAAARARTRRTARRAGPASAAARRHGQAGRSTPVYFASALSG